MSSTYLPLAEDEIHIYISQLSKSRYELDLFYAQLSKDEIDKVNRYIFPPRKNTFLLSRGKLRILLARYLPLDARAYCFEYSENQKPFITREQNSVPPIYFNISHSQDFVLHAFSGKPVLGIDIEYKRRDRPFIALADRFYTDLENQQLQASEDKVTTFYRLWALKEAYLKSLGIGISGGLKNIEYILDSVSNKPELRILNHSAKKTNLHAEEIFIHPDYQSAIVSELSRPRLSQFRDTSR